MIDNELRHIDRVDDHSDRETEAFVTACTRGKYQCPSLGALEEILLKWDSVIAGSHSQASRPAHLALQLPLPFRQWS